jgi:hypothetical protein
MPVFRAEKESKKLLDAKSTEDIIKTWFLGTKYTPAERDSIVAAMMEKGIFPDTWAHDRELKSGLYPDIQDPKFGAQLYNKREFYEARAAAISALEGTDPCNAGVESVFEISPIQTLVSRFLNPKTPYNGLLLYHGVGVGKTCSAVRVGEEYLKFFPLSKVFIIVPQAISGGFKRTIIDPTKLRKEGDNWVSQQCTGMIYPELALQELGKKAKKDTDFSVEEISDVVDKKIRERYYRMGYLQFAYFIQKQLKLVPAHLTGDEKTAAENILLSKIFTDKLIIIDEAHNLRDAVGGPIENDAAVNDVEEVGEEEGATGAAVDTVGGKRLTPLLKRIVKYADGLKLLLMSATPMYNKAAEISHLLNLLIVNDTKDDSPKKLIGNIFNGDGSLKKGGDIIIRTYSQRYISYMRGENPYTFPLRVRPSSAQVMIWPKTQKAGGKEKPIVLSKDTKNILEALPLVHVLPREGSAIQTRLMQVLREGKPEDFKAETWVHLDICNIVYPNEYYGHAGFDSYFSPILSKGDGLSYHSFQWRDTEDDEGIENVDDIFGPDNIKNYAPKMAAILEKLQASTGISFVYSRYVKAGILPMAIMLERAGWTRVFDGPEARPVFRGGSPVSRQCAFCTRKENNHTGAGHAFKPACFVVLTGNSPDTIITPSFSNTLNYASRWPKEDITAPHGGRVKAILGSQITTEGLDLKCVRGIHILDPWYHLNRLEQIIGRGIRFCSHADLDIQFRNCLIYMYALTIPKIETPDLHAYRLSAEKAVAIGLVQREMKIAAMDCNLNIAGLIVRGAPPRRIVDIEGRVIEEYNIDDKKYTSTCDYLEECMYDCGSAIIEGEKNSKTYTYNDAQKRLVEKEERLKALFARDEIAIPIESIRKHVYGDLPWEIVSRALVHILENPNFIIKRADGLFGNLILQNDYLLFQPKGIRSKQIPLAYRYSRVYNILSRRAMVPYRGTILGPAKTEQTTAAPAVSTVAEGAPAVAVPEAANPIDRFNAWMAMVDRAIAISKPGDREVIKLWRPPKDTASFHIQAWGWLLFKFCKVPEIRDAAAQYWVDSAWRPSERKAALEYIVAKGKAHADFSPELIKALGQDIFELTDIAGYKWLNTTSFELETMCLQAGNFGMCPKTYDSLINKKIGVPIDIKTGTGELFGFCVPKKDGTIVFKTLDKANSKRITGAVGADCSLASDLDGYRGRVALVVKIINETAKDLAPYLVSLDPADAATGIAARKARQEDNNIVHIDDLSHIYICIYIETLLRIMDIKKLRKTRWFLNAVEASRAGLKGR